MFRHVAAIIGLTLSAAPALADPPRHDTILVTLDQFMIARSVAAKCGRADAAAQASFQRQYRMVAEQATLALKALASDLTQDHIEKVMADHYGEIDHRVTAIVAQESCNGIHIKEALQKYDTVANVGDTPLIADKNN
jgi:high-affinity K+ transport system ATPase subunit B